MSCYIDDILIGTPTFEEHLSVLSGIFQRLTKFNFTIKLSKRNFSQAKVRFLGLIISRDGIKPDGIEPQPRKLNVITRFEEPKNNKQLQPFLGVYNYYRQFNVNHSKSLDQLHDLPTRDKEWIWQEKHSLAFSQLTEQVKKCIMLKHIIPNAPSR